MKLDGEGCCKGLRAVWGGDNVSKIFCMKFLNNKQKLIFLNDCVLGVVGTHQGYYCQNLYI